MADATTTSQSREDPSPQSAGLAGKLLKLAIGVAALGGILLAGRWLGGYIPTFADWVDGLGIWGPVVFVAGYAIATVAFIPGALLTVAAGAIFGLARGTLYVFFGSTLGASAAFLIARYLARAAIERRLEGRPKFQSIDRAVANEGRKIVFLLRLSPVFPFNLLNYGLGLTRVRFVDYLIACFGMLPGTFLYVYTGKAVGTVAAAAGGAGSPKGPASTALLIVGLLATAVVTTIVTRIARRALADEVGAQKISEEADDG